MQEGLPLVPTRTATWDTKVGSWMSVDVSPDGRTLVLDILGDIYTMPIEGGRATPFTRGMAIDAQPRFSPDGKKVVFTSDRDGGWNVWTISLDKKDTTQVSRGKTNSYESPDWTPDGKYIVVSRNTKLHLFHADGGSGQRLIPAPTQRFGARSSRDGFPPRVRSRASTASASARSITITSAMRRSTGCQSSRSATAATGAAIRERRHRARRP